MLSSRHLFLRQSYLDSYDEYVKSLTKKNYPVWDYVILTASNEAQADFYRHQIERRLNVGKLPKNTHYAVIPDPDGKRIGSGGATLSVMKYIAQHRGNADFSGVRILCIHSGGDSKRVPQYSACGKLFSPVPRETADGRRSTLFDEFIIGMTSVVSRISDGMLVCSGDVLLLFNPLQLDFYTDGAAALSIKESVKTGKNHGVFLSDESGYVGKFLHKQTEQVLGELGAVDTRGNVDIDTGAVIFSAGMLNDLYGLVNSEEKFLSYANDHVRLSFYADFIYPLASGSTLEDYYKEKPEGDFSPELLECRKELWEVLHKYSLKLLRFSPAAFIHFGTTSELLRLMTAEMPEYGCLDWSGNVNTNNSSEMFSAYNSYISPKASIGDGSYIEDSYIDADSVVGENCIISGVTLAGEQIPSGTVLHGLKLNDGRFVVRMYGVDDNPKECRYFGREIEKPLWNMELFTPCENIAEALRYTLSGKTSDEMISLSDGFMLADSKAIPMWQDKIDDLVKIESFIQAIEQRATIEQVKLIFKTGITSRIVKRLEKIAEGLSCDNLESFGKKIRIFYYLSKLVEGHKREYLAGRCFDTICSTVLSNTMNGVSYNDSAVIANDDVTVRLPVRVNFGGGWSDTPPYCMENGGNVLNAAIKLGDEYPIEVTLRKITGNRIVLASEDNGSFGEFTDISSLQDCHNPSDPFALHKAALIACGIIPWKEQASVDTITSRLGGGVYLSTQAHNIPRGSGLGTSSILAGACVKGIYQFIGKEISDDELYSRVVCMEQIMSTGGGWQDQVGGLVSGIKMVSTDAGLKQKIKCVPLDISDKTHKELSERYAIIYTGQRRLARNLLREVVGKYIGSDPDTVEVLYEIQRIAALMRFELEKGNIDGFATLLNKHWELSKKLDGGCTNTCIEQIFKSIEDLIDGRMICGAGGGGFLQVIMKKGVSEEDVQRKLEEVFGESNVYIWKCTLV